MKLNKNILNKILIIVLIIIIFESLNSFYAVKSLNLYNEFNKIVNISYNDYILIQMFKYFNSIILFIVFAVYNYFLSNKLNINLIYKGVWVILILGNILFKFFVYQIESFFIYYSILFQILLIIYIIMIKERGGKLD